MSTGAEFYPTPKDAEVNVKTWFCLSAYLWLARQVEVWVRGGPGWLKLVQKFPFFAPNSSKFKRPPRVRQRSQTGLFYNRGNCLNAHLSKIILRMRLQLLRKLLTQYGHFKQKPEDMDLHTIA